jgi:hypothetical protein
MKAFKASTQPGYWSRVFRRTVEKLKQSPALDVEATHYETAAEVISEIEREVGHINLLDEGGRS